MKLSVSNLAWPVEEENWCIDVLLSNGINAIELAPYKSFAGWHGDLNEKSVRIKEALKKKGMVVSSYQAVCFNTPNCKIFGTDLERKNLVNHMTKIAHSLKNIGGDFAVFGSPGLRAGKQDTTFVNKVFKEIGDKFSNLNIALALETVPKYYGCDFLNNLAATEKWFIEVDLDGIVRHYDTGCQFLSKDFIGEPASVAFLKKSKHLHVSQVDLLDFTKPSDFNYESAVAIQKHYRGKWCVLEMSGNNFTKKSFKVSVENFANLFCSH